jgi:hypothetical protein
MFRPIWYSKALPASFPCDPSVEFQPGMLAQLTVIGNQVMATVSDGTAPIGIIDEVRTKAYTAISWNETIIVPATGVPNGAGQLILQNEIKAVLNNANIVANSFISTVKVELIPVNGVIVFLPGTALNNDLTETGTPDSIKTIVNYTYFIPNIAGEDSTLGSNKMTVWIDKMILQTDMFETNQSYPVNAPLFCSEAGLFTTRKPTPKHISIGMVTAPPSPIGNSALELLWL